MENNLNNFFHNILSDLECRSDTKAYITSVFTKFKTADFDLSKDSVGLLFLQAKYKQDFVVFQNLADWIFFCRTYLPQHLNHASDDYYQNIAQLSYYSCFKLINKQWVLFEELSDRFPSLEKQTSRLLSKNLKF